MTNDKIKVLIVYNGYLPAKNYGGPVVSIANLVDLCGDSADFYIFTLNHDLNDKKTLFNIKTGENKVGKAKVYYFSDKNFTFKNIKREYSKIKPDLVYQNGFFNFNMMKKSLFLSKKYGVPLIIAPRGELNRNAFLIKRIKKQIYTFFIKNIIKKNIYFHATSDEEKIELTNRLVIESNKVYNVPNIPSRINNKISLRTSKNIGEIKIIFLSRIQTKKNLDYAIKILNQIKDIEITFDIYGPIENKEYWEKCKYLMEKGGHNIKYSYCGEVNRDEIFSVFSKYDLFFFPTLSENYGHVIVEALLSSCPVLISDQTPWNDIENLGGGFVYNLKDNDKYSEVIRLIASMDEEKISELKILSNNYINNKLSFENLKVEYLDMFKNNIVTK